jgi:hypothetical protein
MHKPILNKTLKPLLITTSMSVLALALAGCAGMNAKPAYTDADTLSPEEYADAAYVARVERIARARGIDVTWVNAPRHLPNTNTKVATTEEPER